MIKFRIDMKQALNDANFNFYVAKKTKLLSGETYKNVTQQKSNITLQTLNILCLILDKSPEELIEFVPDPTDNEIIKKLP